MCIYVVRSNIWILFRRLGRPKKSSVLGIMLLARHICLDMLETMLLRLPTPELCKDIVQVWVRVAQVSYVADWRF